MKLAVGPLTAPVNITFLDVLNRRHRTSKAFIATLMTRSFEDWSIINNQWRAAAIILSAATGITRTHVGGEVGTAKPVLFNGEKFRLAIRSTHQFIRRTERLAEYTFLEDRERAARMAGGKEIDAATLMGMAGITQGDNPTESFVARELVFYALEGTNPGYTALQAAAIANDALQNDITSIGPGANPTPEEIAGRIAYIRFLEWMANLIPAKARGGVAGALNSKTEAGMSDRVRNLKSLAVEVAAINLAAWSTPANHLLRLLKHPWFVNAIQGKMAVNLQNAIAEFEARNIAMQGFSPWAELEGGAFDPNIVGLPASLAEDLRVPSPMTEEPTHSEDADEKVLLPDIKLLNQIPEAALSDMIERMQIYITGVESAHTDLQMAMDAEITSVPTVPGLPVEPMPRNELLISGITSVTGYPLVDATLDPQRVWSGGQWAMRPLADLRSWHHYTRQAIVDKMVAASSRLPVQILTPTVNPGAVGQIIPVFGNYSAYGMLAPKSLEFLSRAWGRTIADIRRVVASFQADPESFSLRQYAEALRFVGVLYLFPAKAVIGLEAAMNPFEVPKKGGFMVMPFERHHYHSSEPTPSLESSGIVLGTCGRNGHTGHDDESRPVGLHYLILVPFTHLPETAIWDGAWAHLALQPINSELSGKSIVRWVNKGAAKPISALPVTGWRVPEVGEHVWDIIGLDIGSAKARELYIGSPAEDHPEFARHENAVFSMLPKGLPPFAGPLGALPAPANRIG